MDNLKQINPSPAVCFSGHRPDRLQGCGELDAPETARLIKALRKHIEDAVNRGKDTFINGLMAGWDVLAAEQVIILRETQPNIRLVTVAPYSSQFFTHEKCWTEDWKKRAREIYQNSGICISLSKNYRTGIYYERNHVMVDHSSELICYCDGGKGGTQYTMRGEKWTYCFQYVFMLIILKCENALMKTIIDHFGEDVDIALADKEHFYANVRVSASKTFYGWVFALDSSVQIAAPSEAVNAYRSMLDRAKACTIDNP